MRRVVEGMERHQVPLYLVALALGAAVGLLVPGTAGAVRHAVDPAIALLLYATFLGVPFARIGGAVQDVRFVVVVLAVNFLLVPVVVAVLSRVVAHDRALLVGVLLVLLTPCVDYVIVFTGLAGGAHDRLLAVAPLLMLAQMALLPAYLWLLAGPDAVAAVDLTPFVRAFGVLIALPLAAAALTQAIAARASAAAAWSSAVASAMVPLMMLTLGVVVTSQIAAVRGELGALPLVVPVYVAFAAVMLPVGAWVGRAAGLDVPGRRAVMFSGVTRNSLVVLPLALALPAGFEVAPIVVVTQTLVELLVMVALVRLVPRLVR
ncbi:bile acid:sodium symporter [Georgenia sp. Z1491]|uniref:bile acid:sodium symporter n=1 Tax=Georgenia sp. Z1491 TaxID=3416707 RepID=UPI003CFA5DFC